MLASTQVDLPEVGDLAWGCTGAAGAPCIVDWTDPSLFYRAVVFDGDAGPFQAALE